MASNPVDLNALFNFDDLTPIDKVIDKMEKLSQVYEVMISQAERNAKDYAESLKIISSAANKLEQQLLNLDEAEQQQQATIIKLADATDVALKKSEALTIATANEEKAIKTLKDQQAELIKTQKQIADLNDNQTGSLKSLREELKKAIKDYEGMGDATSASVKQDTLNKIKNLSQEINKADAAVKSAKKGVDAAAGSYRELTHQVNDAKQRLKEMEGGIGSTSQEFLDLQEFIKKGSDQLKEFDSAVGDNQREVGNYGIAFEALDDRIGGVIGQLKNMGTQFIKLAKNPFVLALGAIIAGLAAVKGAVTSFNETTGEGEDRAARSGAAIDGVFAALNKRISSAGKGFSDFFENTIGGVKGLTDSVLKGLGNALGLQGYFAALRGEIDATIDVSLKLADQMDAFDQKEREVLLESANQRLEYNKKIEDSNDKLNKTDLERLQARKDAVGIQEKILNDEIALERERLDIITKGIEIQTGDKRDEQLKEINDQNIKIINLEASLFQDRKKNLAAINALQAEIDKAERDRINRRLLANQELNKARLNEEIKVNDELLKDANLTFDQQKNLLEDSANYRLRLIDIEKAQALKAARDTAADRIRAEGKRVEDEIGLDQALAIEKQRINEKSSNDIKRIYEKLGNDIDTVFFKELEKDFKNSELLIQQNTNNSMIDLNSRLTSGLVSVKDYNKEKDAILKQGNINSIGEQLNFLEEELLANETNAERRKKIEKEISDYKLKLSQLTTEEVLKDLDKEDAARQAYNEKLRNEVSQLGLELNSSIAEFGNTRLDENVARLDAQIAKEEETKNRSIAIAGDDAQAKAFIEQDFANKRKNIERQIAAEKRKQAVFQKAADASAVIIQTAKGIATAVAESPITFGLPWSAFMAVTGGLQLARILATPIPAYHTGIESAPGGLSLVGDRGREIIKDSTGFSIAEKPQLRVLERGATVYNNARTESLLRDAKMFGDGVFAEGLVNGWNNSSAQLKDKRESYETQKIVDAFIKGSDKVASAVSRGTQDVYDEAGYRRYERKENTRVRRLDSRFKLQ